MSTVPPRPPLDSPRQQAVDGELWRHVAARRRQRLRHVAGREELVGHDAIEAGPVGWVGPQQPADEAPGRRRHVRRKREAVGGDALVGLLQRRRLERRPPHQHRVPDDAGGNTVSSATCTARKGGRSTKLADDI